MRLRDLRVRLPRGDCQLQHRENRVFPLRNNRISLSPENAPEWSDIPHFGELVLERMNLLWLGWSGTTLTTSFTWEKSPGNPSVYKHRLRTKSSVQFCLVSRCFSTDNKPKESRGNFLPIFTRTMTMRTCRLTLWHWQYFDILTHNNWLVLLDTSRMP